MTYQVLARKWRPGKFSDLVGQSHVLKPLTHALDNERLHHAYLFTGTRGVGKTTLARIVAKCLNCEQGVSSEPCGTCAACIEIAEGRFIDLIEVDAASRTKVEDTRELLENVQYAPSRGRYKIYLIDEVHMLSTHSFNALLKTLEEPPPHVKFLLATTDPQKLPITILSRCLQFNLKNLTPQQIGEYLEQVLQQEKITYEEGALWQLAGAAAGSMRDALTLLDQAISYCEGEVNAAGVSDMIGTPDQGMVYRLLEDLSTQNAAGMLETVQVIAERAPDFQQLLEALLATLHRLAIAQVLPDVVDNSYGDREKLLEFADRFSPEDLQLFYQIGLKGRSDLTLALDARAMFEMLLIRMLVFAPAGVPSVPKPGSRSGGDSQSDRSDSEVAETSGKQKKKPLAPPQSNHNDAADAARQMPDPIPAGRSEVPLPGDTRDPESSKNALREGIETLENTKGYKENLKQGFNPGIERQNGPEESQKSGQPEQASLSIPVSAYEEDANFFDPDQDPDHGRTRAPMVETRGVVERKTRSATGKTPPAGRLLAQETTRLTELGRRKASGNEKNPPAASTKVSQGADDKENRAAPDRTPGPAATPVGIAAPPRKEAAGELPDSPQALDQHSWISLCRHLNPGGITGNLLAHCVIIEASESRVQLCLDSTQSAVYSDEHRGRIEQLLAGHFRLDLSLAIEIGEPPVESPAAYGQRLKQEALVRMRNNFQQDDNVRKLVETFSGEVLEESIAPVQR